MIATLDPGLVILTLVAFVAAALILGHGYTPRRQRAFERALPHARKVRRG